MGLFRYIGLKEKDIVSIIGAGGKTSLMFQLAHELRKNNVRVLLTTTTKIYVPQKEMVDFICIDENKFAENAKINKKGIHIYGTEVNTENKMIGLNENHLNDLASYFDYVLIEADGAKKKKIKGWDDDEPVVYGATTKTIGILDIQAFGMRICESNVHRSERFCKMTHSKEGENITLDHLLSVVVHPQGLFKNAKGEKILFVNKADDINYLNKAEQLKVKMNMHSSMGLNKIIIGSIKNNRYYV
ncbi:MAG: hypothetical protein A2Y23_06105 [Clostridiales bacterium GWB2_37_7]|nr:MAG: hypothetical protein A2Y23_06105 [Clostridiales bacterium GWB2_37_7]